MSFNSKRTFVPKYAAPKCEACEALEGAVICQSGDIEDWVYDEEEF